MFFSSNVPEEEALRLSWVMGIPLKKMVGKYLGHHIVLKGRDKEMHNDLPKRIHSKIDWWKLKCLSNAGRLTLVQSVLGSIPIFYMQLEQLPGWIHKELDKETWKCIWGKVRDKRGVHLRDWDMLCKPKKNLEERTLRWPRI